jgi:hypothetical protein
MSLLLVETLAVGSKEEKLVAHTTGTTQSRAIEIDRLPPQRSDGSK